MSSIKLHVGGQEPREGWKILNIQERPGVDYVGTCYDLSFLADGSCAEVYASHVLEHLGYRLELTQAIREIYRVLAPGGRARISVPNLEVLCRIFLQPNITYQDRLSAMRMMFGGQMDEYDFHFAGLWPELVDKLLTEAGFARIARVDVFGEFADMSNSTFGGQRISYNVEAYK